MRIGVIGDLHLGKTLYGYDLTPHIRRAMYEFLDLCLFVEADAAVCLGDVYDRPAPSVALQKMVIQWVNEFERAGIDLFLLAGNHDVTSSHAAPTALESIRVAAPFKHVQVIDRPVVIREVGTMLPFPSPGIYDSHEHYVAMVNLLHQHEPFVFSHLNIEGAKLGDQEFVYRGAEHFLPEVNGTVLAGHIHKPQRTGDVQIVGAAERTSFAERWEERHLVLILRGRAIRFKRATALPLVQVEPDVSGWGTGGSPPSTDDVVQDLAPRVSGALVKVAPFVDERTVVDWSAVERGLLDAGALSVTIAPATRVQKARSRHKSGAAASDPVAAAARFIKQRVGDERERKRLLVTFKRIQKEADHGSGEVRG